MRRIFSFSRFLCLFCVISLFFSLTLPLISCSGEWGAGGNRRDFDINHNRGETDTAIFNQESGFRITYPTPTEELNGEITAPPYVKAHLSTDGTKIVLQGTGDEDAIIRIDDGEEIYVARVEKGVFQIELPTTDEEVTLNVSARLSGKKRSGAVIVTKQAG